VAASDNGRDCKNVRGRLDNCDLKITSGSIDNRSAINLQACGRYAQMLITASVSTVAELKAAITSGNTGNTSGVDDVIALTGNITLARSADAIKTNVTNGQTMALVGGGSTLSGGGLARVRDVNASGAISKVAIDNLTMASGRAILIGAAGTCVICEDTQSAGSRVSSGIAEMANRTIDVAGGVVEWGRADAAERVWPAC